MTHKNVGSLLQALRHINPNFPTAKYTNGSIYQSERLLTPGLQ